MGPFVDVQLTANFKLSEMVGYGTSRWATLGNDQLSALASTPKHGVGTVQSRVKTVARILLQPIRNYVNRPVIVNCGLRSLAWNTAVAGSSPTSQHIWGEATDFFVRGYTDAQLFDLWAWLAFESNLPSGQVIYEDRRPNLEGGAWIHASLGAPWRDARRCGQALTCVSIPKCCLGYKRCGASLSQ